MSIGIDASATRDGRTKPCLGYPSRTAAVLALLGEGRKPREVAVMLGIEPSRVSNLAWSGRLVKGRRTADRMPRAVVRGGKTMVVSRETLALLEQDADRRGITVNELARRLLDRIAQDRLVVAVLDDEVE